MRLADRINRWLVPTGMLACVVLAAAWVVSEVGIGHVEGKYGTVCIDGGAFEIYSVVGMKGTPPGSVSWGYNRNPGMTHNPRLWRPSTAVFGVALGPNTGTTGRVLILPIWILLVLVSVPTVWLFWRGRRRVPPHCCRGCGYDLTGNVSGVCPECGHALAGCEGSEE